MSCHLASSMSVFLSIPQTDIIFRSKFFFVVRDKFPVSKGHSLIISNRKVLTYFDLLKPEKLELIDVIDKVKQQLELELKPNGFNVGFNCGEAAGQTVMHFHCHVIPRYFGDMKDPRGGIRHCINGKGYY